MPDIAKLAFVEPLKLTDHEHAKLILSFAHPDDRRSHTRFAAPPGFKVLVRFDAGSAATLAVRVPVSDLSIGGIGVFHSAFICPGAGCVVSMLSIDREAISLRGVVAHCEFVAGRAHVVGVRFESAIEPAAFLLVTLEHPKPQAPASGADGRAESTGSGADAPADPASAHQAPHAKPPFRAGG